MNRRQLLKASLWSVPVVAAAVAVPAHAASVATKDRLTFNTSGSWDENPNGERALIGVVVAAMDTTGPDAVGLVTFTVTIEHDGGTETRPYQAFIARGWCATDDWTTYFDNLPTRAYRITLTASAAGCTTITKTWEKK